MAGAWNAGVISHEQELGSGVTMSGLSVHAPTMMAMGTLTVLLAIVMIAGAFIWGGPIITSLTLRGMRRISRYVNRAANSEDSS